jgi:hypothetical protein
MTILRAAISYWASIFALGFVLGTVRTLWGATELGETTFILIEIPLLLTASWFVASWLVQRYDIEGLAQAAAIGAFAFALLMIAELALATGFNGQDPRDWFAGLWQTPHIYGTLAQLVFGLIPVLAFSTRN